MTEFLKDKDNNMVEFNLHRLIIYIVISIIFVFFISFISCAEEIKIDEIVTGKGKIIIGLSRQEAIKNFGLPSQASEKFWYYHKPEKFWIYFKGPSKLISISILPKYAETSLEHPVMFKAIGEFSDFSGEDISDQVQWVSEDEEIVGFIDGGIILPLDEGTAHILAFSNDIISTVAELNVTKKEEKSKKQKIELISVDILPHKPHIFLPREELVFKSWGTFKNNETGEYFIEDISDEVIWQSKDEDKLTFVDNIANLTYFRPAEIEIFCIKDEVVSPVQTLSVLDSGSVIQDVKLESITVLPRTVIIEKGRKLNFRAFGTFNDASIEEITLEAEWKLKDYKIARVIDKGKLVTKMPGITEVQADMDEVFSEPRKLVVLAQAPKTEEKVDRAKREKTKTPAASMVEVEKQVKKLEEQLASSLRRKLKSIQIFPPNPKVPLGKHVQFRAKAEYTDGSSRDLTLQQVKWQSSNNNVATIGNDGIAQSKSLGISLITASLNKIKSNSQKLTVIAPELVSIDIAPKNPTIFINQTIQFKAEGNYTDKSTRDITAEVDWKSENGDIVKFSPKGKLEPQKLGKVKIFAKHKQIESPRQLITIMPVSATGVLWIIILRLLGLFLFGGLIFLIIIYLRRRVDIQRLKKVMYRDPRSFIIRLYDNLIGVLALYDTGRRKSIPPGEYAKLVKRKYPEKDIDKLGIFTERFNEARYSSHTMAQEAAYASAREYDVIIACVMKFHRLRSNFIKYLWIIVRKLPLKISS